MLLLKRLILVVIAGTLLIYLVFQLQVGSPNDQYCWMPPEDINYQRKATQCFIGCADIAAEMAASLASASIVFKDNKHYSLKLLRTAVTVHSYAESMIHRTTDSSKLDEIIWSATWLYYATGNVTYLDRATSHILADRAGDFSRSYVFSSDNKIVGTQVTSLWIYLFVVSLDLCLI